jgi:23S rRNA pseudouridine955/2504/2580 synthase
MTRFMRKDGKAVAAAAAPSDKAASYEIGEDESGMRLDRWLHRRFPDVANSHLMRIVRKGEVRVSGKRADISTRLETGTSVRVPPLRIAPPEAPAIKRANPG